MAKLYSALVALPSRSFGVISGAIGIPAAFWPTWFENKVGVQVTADAIQTIGICLMAASIAYFALLWWLKPGSGEDASTTINTSGGIGIGHVSGGDFSQHTHNAPRKFSGVFEVTTLPSHMGGNRTVDLDGVATLNLFPPWSLDTATMMLDSVPMKQPDVNLQGAQFTDIRFTTGPQKKFTFNTGDDKRHTMEAGGKVFIVTLRETEQLAVEGVANPLKFVFAVKEA